MIHGRKDSRVAVVVHLLLVDEVAFRGARETGQPIVGAGFLVVLVLLVVAVAMGIVEGGVQRPVCSGAERVVELVMALVVVVGLVVVVMHVAELVVIGSHAVVGRVLVEVLA